MEFPEPLVLFHVLTLRPAKKLVQKKRCGKFGVRGRVRALKAATRRRSPRR